jgi:hypothetical protein
MSAAKPNVRLDFVLYAGDPEEGAPVLTSERALAELEQWQSKLSLDDTAYGAVTLHKDGRSLVDNKPDPILKLITKLVRTVSYVIDSEPETVLLSESEHGFLIERVSDDVRITFFRGSDPFEPEETLIEGLIMPLDDYAGQVIEMGDRILELTKRAVPDRWSSDELCGGLIEFLEVAKSETKSFRLERDRVRRR